MSSVSSRRRPGLLHAERIANLERALDENWASIDETIQSIKAAEGRLADLKQEAASLLQPTYADVAAAEAGAAAAQQKAGKLEREAKKLLRKIDGFKEYRDGRANQRNKLLARLDRELKIRRDSHGSKERREMKWLENAEGMKMEGPQWAEAVGKPGMGKPKYKRNWGNKAKGRESERVAETEKTEMTAGEDEYSEDDVEIIV